MAWQLGRSADTKGRRGRVNLLGMARYQLNIGVLLKTGAMGPNFSLQIDADNFDDALEKAKPAIAQTLADSGLVEVPPKAPASSPESALGV